MIVRRAAARRRQMRGGWGVEADYLAADAGGGHLSLRVYHLVPSSVSGPLHRHTASDSAYFVLAGSIRVRIDTAVGVLMPGDLAFIPAGTAHAVANAGDVEASFVELYAPGAADFVRLDETTEPEVASPGERRPTSGIRRTSLSTSSPRR